MTSDSPIRPQLAVSASIFRDGRVLLIQRAHPPAKGSWSVPGGRVEFGEPLHIALAREVMEETGLEIEILGLAGWREVLPAVSGAGKHYVVMSFAARWVAGEPVLNGECDDFAWLPPDALGSRQLTPGLQDIVDAARVLAKA
ncbi:NUDIX domain-containing protein [Tardiphaga sp. vice352]|uniref:NUDIX hydrolase n=1 Tax=unclassified Tardiphaga TaxID=2631404 RepID=UPI001163E209|nr:MULTISPECIES: NUDIX hydrolase [unclassified Tardiphaga]MBC7586422.1 NUDIX hydrolase [Tardiphaga sp.]QDM18660.1 NUDIX domain-containing protein [Tardiphaga sp. vice278]QDM23656.1 NUDIX domain-containing protein [Tardiphaga sp. vice154]QDM28880.1 NUDIX domain-containing protein [Tardiphaga sp. vice304]QDM33980.1 NUDIX domain-containing protein [Tardiphaga sp. vice352]